MDETTMPARAGEGYLVTPGAWSATVAADLAGEIGIELTNDYWSVLRFMRQFYEEHQVAADARFAFHYLGQRYTGQGRRRLFELFPYGYLAQAARLPA